MNHQISERKWRFRVFPGARLFQCLETTPKLSVTCLSCAVCGSHVGHLQQARRCTVSFEHHDAVWRRVVLRLCCTPPEYASFSACIRRASFSSEGVARDLARMMGGFLSSSISTFSYVDAGVCVRAAIQR